jgi:hypothetical protein
MPGSILQGIERAVRDGNFSCERKTLFSGNFFELDDKRLLLLLGIPDYLCASNSFVPVVVDDRGEWRAGPILAGEPSFLVRGPGKALWLAAQWQVEGTFPALYRSQNGVDWQEIKLPGERDVDCCFETLERICFHHGRVRLRFASATTGKTASWEAGLEGLAGTGPAWKQTDAARDAGRETPCPFIRLGQGSWCRTEADGSGDVFFKKNGGHYKISVVVPGSLE